jgi:hypothetical protein
MKTMKQNLLLKSRYIIVATVWLLCFSCQSKNEEDAKTPDTSGEVTPPSTKPDMPDTTGVVTLPEVPETPEKPIIDENPDLLIKRGRVCFLPLYGLSECNEYMIDVESNGSLALYCRPDSLPEEFKVDRLYVKVSYHMSLEKYNCDANSYPIINVSEIEIDKDRPEIPFSIDEVAAVLEIKYGEVKEWHYNGRIFKFSITDVEDHLLPCALFDFGGEPESYNKTRLQVGLRLETDKEMYSLIVSTSPCFAYFYQNDETDIQHVWNILKSWQSTLVNPANDDSYFKQNFERTFGEGTAFDDETLGIHIAKVFPCRFDSEHLYNVENSMYKFIFIVTTCSNNKI